MHAVRMKEPLVIPDAVQEIEELERFSAKQDSGLGNKLQTYHQRRRAKVSALIDLLS